MTSRLAKDTIEGWQREGLQPTFEDIILLNALGLQVERGPDSADFSALPRVAFLGDYCLWQPTIRKQLWLEKAQMVVNDGFLNKLCLYAYALNADADELPDLSNTKDVVDAVSKFANDVLVDYTEDQLVAAIDYVLNGNDPTSNEEYADKPEVQEVVSIPNGVKSVAQVLLHEAAMQGIGMDAVDMSTVPQLERMVLVAIMRKGVDIRKDQQMQNSGKFFAAVGKIHKRLVDEKNLKE